MKKYLKLYRFIFLFCFPLCSLSAQEGTDSLLISYTANDRFLEEIFNDLEEEYGIRFSYATETILDKKVDCTFEEITIEEAIDFLLEDQFMEHKRMGENFLLRKKEEYEEPNSVAYNQSVHITGTITLADSKEPIEYAAISISNSATGTFTNEDGTFDLEIPKKHLNDSLIIHSLGMEDKKYAIKDVEGGFLFIGLESGSFDLNEVVILNKKQKIKVFNDLGAVGIDLSSDSYGGIISNDLTRQLQKLAGISAADDSSSEIKIRGSQSDETLVILDGMPIYNCSHYFGVFNSINTNFIDQINLYRSYFPLQYGGKTGGIVELMSRENINQKNETSVSVDLMAAALHSQVKLSNSLSLNVAARSTLQNISNNRFNSFGVDNGDELISIEEFSSIERTINTNPRFSFLDVNAKLLWQLRPNHSISVNGFYNKDEYSNAFSTKIRDKNNKELSIDATENDQWGNRCFSLNNTLQYANYSTWETSIYTSYYQDEGSVEIEILKPTFEGQKASSEFVVDLNQNNQIQNFGIKSFYNKIFNKGDVTLGMEAIRHDVDYRLEDNKDQKIKGEEAFYDFSGFTGITISPFKPIVIRLGARSTYYSVTEDLYVSPRALLTAKLSNRITLKGSYGYYQQFVRELGFEFRGEPRKLWVYAGKNEIPVLKSQNLMVGINLLLEVFSLDIELYRKDFSGLTEFTVLNPGRGNNNNGPGNRDYELFKGGGFSRGIDISIQKSIKRFSSSLAYTLSESRERYKDIFAREYYPSEDDRRHQLKWMNELDYKSWALRGDWIYLSGSPYYNLSKIGKDGDIRDLSSEDRVVYVDYYSRIDLSLSYDFSIKSKEITTWFSVLNLLDRHNIKYVQTISESIENNSNSNNLIISNEHSLLNRTINFGIKVDL